MELAYKEEPRVQSQRFDGLARSDEWNYRTVPLPRDYPLTAAYRRALWHQRLVRVVPVVR